MKPCRISPGCHTQQWVKAEVVGEDQVSRKETIMYFQESMLKEYNLNYAVLYLSSLQ